MTRFRIALLLLFTGACTQSGGLSYTNIDVAAQHQDGSAVENFPEDGCTTLPLLLGSRIQERFSVAEGIVVELDASRDLVQVDFQGVSAQSPSGTSVSLEQLHSGYGEQFELTSQSGGVFLVTLQAGCP